MSNTKPYKAELRELYESYTGKELEAVMPVSLRQVQKYLQEENAPEPGVGVQRTIHELFIKHKEGKPLIEEAPRNNNADDPTKMALVRTLENLSEDKIRSTGIIERLVSLLEQQFSSYKLATHSEEPLSRQQQGVASPFETTSDLEAKKQKGQGTGKRATTGN